MKGIYQKPELKNMVVDFDVITDSLNVGDMNWISKDEIENMINGN